MPTTNISQILPDVIKHVRFTRREQKRFVLSYSPALFMTKNALTSKYVTPDKTMIKRLVNRIKQLGEFYPMTWICETCLQRMNVSEVYCSIRDQIGLRGFLEKIRINYYLWLATKRIEACFNTFPHPFESLVNSKCITWVWK